MRLHINKLIATLQARAQQGEEYISEPDLVTLAYGERAGKENRARKEIIRRIIRAKREAGFSLKSNFFNDVWPEALEALLEKREKAGDCP